MKESKKKIINSIYHMNLQVSLHTSDTHDTWRKTIMYNHFFKRKFEA